MCFSGPSVAWAAADCIDTGSIVCAWATPIRPRGAMASASSDEPTKRRVVWPAPFNTFTFMGVSVTGAWPAVLVQVVEQSARDVSPLVRTPSQQQGLDDEEHAAAGGVDGQRVERGSIAGGPDDVRDTDEEGQPARDQHRPLPAQ